jgi:teichoic acid transport system ATP-binding protein
MEKTVIKFENVVKKYKLFRSEKLRFLSLFSKRIKYITKLAVDDVSFTIKRGESVAIIGKNGAGKSTVLKMITGVTYPTSGKIDVKGRVSALLELTAGFDAELTGKENMYLRAQIFGMKDSEMKAVEQDIIDFSEIGDYIDQPVRTYSSGMLARLGFAINVNIEPEILIVDEALSVGDSSFKDKCLKKVNEIINKDHVTLLFVTHDINTAANFCTRGMVMENGKIVLDDNINKAAKYYKGE